MKVTIADFDLIRRATDGSAAAMDTLKNRFRTVVENAPPFVHDFLSIPLEPSNVPDPFAPSELQPRNVPGKRQTD